MQLSTIGNQATMTSLDLLEIINQERANAGESQVRKNDFNARCKDELEDMDYETFVVKNPNGTSTEVLQLSRDQCMLISMRESKVVRRNVLEKLKTASTSIALPDFNNPAIAARAWAEQYEARLLAESTKAQIGQRREATAMNTASQAVKKVAKLEIELDKSKDYATVKRMEMLYHGQSFNWRHLKSTAADLGVSTIDVFDANYGTVKAYHASVWMEAYAITIDQS